MKPTFANILMDEFSDTFIRNGNVIKLKNEIDSSADISVKTEIMNKVTTSLRDKGLISGWRNELFPLSTSFSNQPVMLLERAACPYFGVKAYGVHVNGYVVDNNNKVSHLWVAKRSKTKSTWPSMYDHIVAGGQPYGISLAENVAKECKERGLDVRFLVAGEGELFESSKECSLKEQLNISPSYQNLNYKK
jgi:hypothetical protein